MTHSQEQPNISPDILEGTPYQGRRVVEVYTNGEFSKAARIKGSPEDDSDIIIKTSLDAEARLGGRLTKLEAHTLARLAALKEDDNVAPAPIDYPYLLDSNSTEQASYIAYKHIEGETLTLTDVEHNFSVEEKRLLGQQIGLSIAWIAQHFPLEDHHEDVRSTGLEGVKRPGILDYSVDPKAEKTMQDAGLDVYADIFKQLRDEYHRYTQEGRIEPTIVGHDDLRISNMAFNDHSLRGVFDFGELKATSCEREFRQLAHLGNDVLFSAMAAYGQAADQRVDPELVMFWTKLHTAMNSGYRRLSGSYRENPDEPSRIAFLQEQYPDRDFLSLYPDFH